MAITASDHVRILESSSGREIARLHSPRREQLAQAYPEGASGIAFSPNGGMLAVGSDGGVIQLWDLDLLRQGLSRLGLDWDQPATSPSPISPAPISPAPISPAPISPAPANGADLPLHVEVVGADLLDRLAKVSPSAQATEDDARAHQLRGQLYFAHGFTREAQADHQRAVEILSRKLTDKPDDVDVLMRRARSYLRLAEYRNAISDTTHVIELQPDLNHGYFWRGCARMMLRDDELAVRDFRKSLAIKPRDGWPFRHLAWIYLTSSDSVRDLDEALKAAKRAVDLEPNNNSCLTTLGVVYYRQGKHQQALEVLRKAEKSTSNEVQAVRSLALAMTQYQLAEPAVARQCYQDAVRLLDELGEPASHRRADLEALRAEAKQLISDKP